MAPRTTEEILAQAGELADRFERGELPGPGATHLDGAVYRAILDAFEQRAHAEVSLADAVQTARKAGASWAAIGAMIGVTGEAVRARYGLATSK